MENSWQNSILKPLQELHLKRTISHFNTRLEDINIKSEMEKAFLWAYLSLTLFDFRLLNRLILEKELNDANLESIFYLLKCMDQSEIPYIFCLVPQYEIKPYRIDFNLFTFFIERFGKKYDIKSISLLIEIDGHEYHGLNKDQFVKDRKKDRFLRNKNYDIFRFSGSEIFLNPLKCVSECVNYAEKRIFELFLENERLIKI